MNGIFLDTVPIDNSDMDMSGISSVLTDLRLNKFTNSEDVLHEINGKQVVISNKVVLDEMILNQATDLRLICIAATGTDHINIDAAKSNNIVVCNIENYANESVSQHVFGLILSLLRNFPAYQKALNNNQWQNNKSFSMLSFNIDNLSDKTLGIIGYGALGKAVERLAFCFGMKVIIAEHKGVTQQQLRAGRMSFDSVLEQSDIVTLHCPLSNETRNSIAKPELQKMKVNSILINTARGGIVDEHALLTALESQAIAGAGIDVLNQEPPSEDSVLLQESAKKLDSLIVTPHIAWASMQSRQKLLDKIAQNINHFITGQYKELPNFYF